jgi:Fe-S-cluster-containing dehydrogenase component
MKRRDFFKVLAGTPALLASSHAQESHDAPVIDCDESFAVLVDTTACIGCRKCEWACNRVNHLTDKPLSAYEDKSVFSRHRRPDQHAFTVVNQYSDADVTVKQYTMKVQCMHCLHPACVSACIVGALRQDKQGPVVYDAWKCIGCRYCLVACPFQIPAYEYDNPADPQVRKCTFCYERLTQEGKVPACVEICPTEALTFGTRRDLLEAAHTRIAMNPEKYVDHVYGETEAGGTSWLYLSATAFAQTELPPLDSRPIPERTETIQHGIFKSFIPPLVLYGLLGLIMHAARNGENGAEHHD